MNKLTKDEIQALIQYLQSPNKAFADTQSMRVLVGIEDKLIDMLEDKKKPSEEG